MRMRSPVSILLVAIVAVVVVALAACGPTLASPPVPPDTLYYGFSKTAADGSLVVSYYDLATGAMDTLPNTAGGQAVMFDEQQALSSCLDPYRQYIYTVGIVGGEPYLAGYSINSGEVVTLTSLSDDSTSGASSSISIYGCGSASNEDSVWLLNTSNLSPLLSIRSSS